MIGRDKFLDGAELDRLKWRRENVIVDRKRIHCLTYDELHYVLQRKFDILKRLVVASDHRKFE